MFSRKILFIINIAVKSLLSCSLDTNLKDSYRLISTFSVMRMSILAFSSYLLYRSLKKHFKDTLKKKIHLVQVENSVTGNRQDKLYLFRISSAYSQLLCCSGMKYYPKSLVKPLYTYFQSFFFRSMMLLSFCSVESLSSDRRPRPTIVP